MPFEFNNREMWEAATYAVVPLDEGRWSVPDQSRGLTLTIHPDLMHQTLICPADRISSSVIEKLATRHRRIKREMVLEWVRVHLSELLPYFRCVENDPKLAKFPGSYYVEGRMIFKRCTGLPAPRVASLDERRRQVAFKDGREELERIRKAREFKERIEKIIAVREQRYEHYSEIYEDDDEHWSSLSWRGQLPGSKVELDDKYSRKDLRAIYFSEACDDDRVLDRRDVDLVVEEEYRERNPCEPVPKKRKQSHHQSTPLSRPLTEWEAEARKPCRPRSNDRTWQFVGSEPDDVLELGVSSNELSGFR